MLARIRALLDIPEGQDEKLQTIVELTESRLLSLLETEELPAALEYIVVEVSISRFNRIGSEGYTSHSVEGENVSLSTDDFAPYMSDISAWKGRLHERERMKTRFL